MVELFCRIRSAGFGGTINPNWVSRTDAGAGVNTKSLPPGEVAARPGGAPVGAHELKGASPFRAKRFPARN